MLERSTFSLQIENEIEMMKRSFLFRKIILNNEQFHLLVDIFIAAAEKEKRYNKNESYQCMQVAGFKATTKRVKNRMI